MEWSCSTDEVRLGGRLLGLGIKAQRTAGSCGSWATFTATCRVGLAPTGKAPPCHGARHKRSFTHRNKGTLRSQRYCVLSGRCGNLSITVVSFAVPTSMPTDTDPSMVTRC